MSRSNVGGIIVALMMQQLNKTRPDDYLLAMRVLWVPIGLMILVRPLHIA
jgi:SP family general alpha glucoside:H+ symporter-like MFS transporter